jgi:hypothetical protein
MQDIPGLIVEGAGCPPLIVKLKVAALETAAWGKLSIWVLDLVSPYVGLRLPRHGLTLPRYLKEKGLDKHLE